MLVNTGERQVGKTLQEIKGDHRERYLWAAEEIREVLGESTVLDAACGAGYGSFALNAYGGHTVLGVDISEDAISHAQRHFSSQGVSYLELDLNNGLIPNLEQPFDVVVSFETIEHVEDPLPILKTFNLMAPYLIASVPNQAVVPFSKETHPFHHRHYTVAEFQQLLESAGYCSLIWYTQHDKEPGKVVEGVDGRTLIAICERV